MNSFTEDSQVRILMMGLSVGATSAAIGGILVLFGS